MLASHRIGKPRNPENLRKNGQISDISYLFCLFCSNCSFFFANFSPIFGISGFFYSALSVLKCCVPKTLAFAFGLRLRSKTRCFKTRVLGRRLPNGKPQERLRFRALRSKMLAFKKRIAVIFCDLKTSLSARACV